jgi:anti-sigma factor RsiW
MHPEDAVLNDFVDDALGASERQEVARHLETCAACRQMVDDMSEIRKVAGSLDEREPPARAWSRIERAIDLEQQAGAGAAVSRTTSPAGRPWAWLAAAAVLTLATLVGVRYGLGALRAPAAPASTGQSAAAGEVSAQDVEAELRAAESHYDKAIKGLEQIANSERGSLDPATAATLQKNLAVIDQAISESRAAVREQPTSEPAAQRLMENFRTKLALLQDTVALINEMRKGNEAGTARVVSGLKQKGD